MAPKKVKLCPACGLKPVNTFRGKTICESCNQILFEGEFFLCNGCFVVEKGKIIPFLAIGVYEQTHQCERCYYTEEETE
jgi:hypothetical protein